MAPMFIMAKQKYMNIMTRMNKRMKLTLSTLLLAGMMGLSAGQVNAADIVDLNLEESVQRAYANNRTLKQAIANRESAYWSLSTARRQSNPTVSLQMNGLKVGGKSYPTYNRAFSNTATVSMPIYTGGQLEEQRASARYNLNSADLELENSLQIVRETAMHWKIDRIAQLLIMQ